METPNPSEQKPEPVVYNEETAVLKEKLLIALVVTDKGPGIMAKLLDRESVIMAKGEIDAYLTKILIAGDMRADAMRSGKMVPAKGGILNFARKRF